MANIPRSLICVMAIAAFFLFLCLSLKHAFFFTSAFDLGIFDQPVYLISQGLPPYSTVRKLHILGDHAALIFYPLALLYAIYPDIHWLFAVQALALSIGVLPLWGIAQQAGLSRAGCWLPVAAYLSYPVVFNVNVAGFYPEAIAPAAILWALWAVRAQRSRQFVAAILLTLSLKAVLSLTVAVMGLWLLIFERYRRWGGFAIAIGISWFLIATQWIIPAFSGREAAAVHRYSYLGNSVLEIAVNLFLRPSAVVGRVFSIDSLMYLGLLVVPVLWGLSRRSLPALLPILPIVLLNSLSIGAQQRSLDGQYNVPVLPFLLMAVVITLSDQPQRLHYRRYLWLWLLLVFLWLGRYGALLRIVKPTSHWAAAREAIAQIQSSGGVIANRRYIPHLSHRAVVRSFEANAAKDLSAIDYILIDRGRYAKVEQANGEVLRASLDNNLEFRLHSERHQVLLFCRTSICPPV